MDPKRFLAVLIIIILAVLATLASVTFYLDPLFHYRAPRQGYYYDLPEQNERLQNDGIMRHFDYDAIVTGTSMCQNFKTSEVDALFDTKSIKTCFSGGTFYEIANALDTAFAANPEIRYVFRGIDYIQIPDEPDKLNYDAAQYPEYITNGPGIDDINYLLSKTVFFDYTVNMIKDRIAGVPGGVESFDVYENYTEDIVNGSGYGYDALVALYGDVSYQGPGQVQTLSEEEAATARENAAQNITRLANEHPDTQFYLFLTPYSIYYWKLSSEEGTIDKQIDAEKIMIEEVIGCDNIHLYSFNDMEDVVCDLDNFSDKLHYSEKINSMILEYMKEGKGLITKDNYISYLERERKLYNDYDYYGHFY